MKIDTKLKPTDMTRDIERVLTLAARKSRSIAKGWDPSNTILFPPFPSWPQQLIQKESRGPLTNT